MKNSPSVSFFKNAWNLVKLYWESKDVKKEFIEAFKKEYIDKVQPFRYIGHQSSAPDKKRFLCKILKASRKLQKEFRTKVYKY